MIHEAKVEVLEYQNINTPDYTHTCRMSSNSHTIQTTMQVLTLSSFPSNIYHPKRVPEANVCISVGHGGVVVCTSDSNKYSLYNICITVVSTDDRELEGDIKFEQKIYTQAYALQSLRGEKNEYSDTTLPIKSARTALTGKTALAHRVTDMKPCLRNTMCPDNVTDLGKSWSTSGPSSDPKHAKVERPSVQMTEQWTQGIL